MGYRMVEPLETLPAQKVAAAVAHRAWEGTRDPIANCCQRQRDNSADRNVKKRWALTSCFDEHRHGRYPRYNEREQLQGKPKTLGCYAVLRQVSRLHYRLTLGVARQSSGVDLTKKTTEVLDTERSSINVQQAIQEAKNMLSTCTSKRSDREDKVINVIWWISLGL